VAIESFDENGVSRLGAAVPIGTGLEIVGYLLALGYAWLPATSTGVDVAPSPNR